jgi:hypothetical protein
MEESEVITVFVPMSRGRATETERFYSDGLNFQVDEGGQISLSKTGAVVGQLQYIERKSASSPLPVFQFCIKRNFPGFCARLKGMGYKFEVVAMTPGGYGAIVIEPSENEIHIHCASFESDDDGLDITKWQEYLRY